MTPRTTNNSRVRSLFERSQPSRSPAATTRRTSRDASPRISTREPSQTPQRRALERRTPRAAETNRIEPGSAATPRIATRGTRAATPSRNTTRTPTRGAPRTLTPRRADSGRGTPGNGLRSPRLGRTAAASPNVGQARAALGTRALVGVGATGVAPRLGARALGAGFGPRVGVLGAGRNQFSYGVNALPHVLRYNRGTLFGNYRYLNGCYHFGLHAGLFWPQYRHWGAYGLGFGWQGSQLCYANTLNPSFVLRWRSWSPLTTTVSWWWPSACYYPSAALGFTSATAFAFGPGGGFFGGGFGGFGGGGFVDTGVGTAAFDPGFVDPVVDGLDPVDVPVGAPLPPLSVEDAPPLNPGAPLVVESTEPAPETSPAENASRRHLDLGDFYFREMRYDDAAEAYVRALSYTPDDGSIHFVAADALFASADYHYAAYMIRKGLELDPGLADIDADKRLFYDDPATFEGQMDVLRAYIDQKPFDAAARLVLAYNLRYSGQKAEAIKTLDQVLEIEPGHYAALVLLRALNEKDTPDAPAEIR